MVTGQNGSGKSNIYRALRLLAGAGRRWRRPGGGAANGTLRYLLLAAALLTPRPPELIVLNEPETSLHPDLLPALERQHGETTIANIPWQQQPPWKWPAR